MTYIHLRTHKAYLGSNQPHIFSSICIYSLFQKLQSTISVIVLCSSCLLYTTGFRCDPKGSHPSEVMEPDPTFSRSTASSLQISPSSLAKGVEPLSVDPLPLKQDQLSSIVGALTKDGAGMTHPTNVGLRQLSLLEELRSAGLPSIHESFNCGMLPHEAISSTDINRHNAILEALKDLKSLIRREKEVKAIIESIKIVTLIDTLKDKIILGWSNKTPLKSRPALQSMAALQSALALEKSYQQQIGYIRPNDLNADRKSVVDALNSLEQSIGEEHAKVHDAAESLDSAIQYLESIYDTLYEVSKSYRLYRLDQTEDMSHSIKQLLIGDDVQLKEVKKILYLLEDMELNQLSLILNFRKKISQIQEVLVNIKTNIEILKSDLCKEQLTIKDLRIKYSFGPEVQIIQYNLQNITRLREIIADLKSEEQYVSNIGWINYKDSNNRNEAEIDKTLKDALEIEGCVKDILSIIAHIIHQTEALKALLVNMDPLGDEGSF